MKTKIIGQERIVRELGRVFDIFSASGGAIRPNFIFYKKYDIILI